MILPVGMGWMEDERDVLSQHPSIHLIFESLAPTHGIGHDTNGQMP